jgi:hypothetical protein
LRAPPNPRASATPQRAFWAWDAAWWIERPNDFRDRLGAAGATAVYITVPMTADAAVTEPDRLARFVAMAGRAGIRVLVVEGDPHAILPGERPKFVQRARALSAYNRTVALESRLAGVQYDIEPYLVPGLTFDPSAWQSAYLTTLRELRAAIDATLEIAAPFWWATMTDGFLDGVAASVDGLTIMNYRTELRQIEQSAEPLLFWGLRHGKPVRVGLEAGPLPDETRHSFRPADIGEVWLVTVAGSDVLVTLSAPAANPGGVALRRVDARTVSASETTFHADRSRLDTLLPEIERRLAPWPINAGIALHGLFK